jgi:2-phospho-L-lactate transferase/gluconeogenesis factor (CofD/UPF0052 family)
VCQGGIFKSVEIVKDLMEKAKTKSGLSMIVTILDNVYQTGRKVTEEVKQTMEIVFDEYLPKWNYTAKPQVV